MAQGKKRHQWTEADWLYCLYVAKFIERPDRLGFVIENRISQKIYGSEGREGSILRGCLNFDNLLGRKGFAHCSELQKETFKKYSKLHKEELYKKAFG